MFCIAPPSPIIPSIYVEHTGQYKYQKYRKYLYQILEKITTEFKHWHFSLRTQDGINVSRKFQYSEYFWVKRVQFKDKITLKNKLFPRLMQKNSVIKNSSDFHLKIFSKV